MPPPNMALQRARRPRFRSGRSLRALGSPLNAYSLGAGASGSNYGRCIVVIAVVLAVTVATPVPGEIKLVGLWESKATSSGGIGHAMEFRADGTFVQATTVIVDGSYRLIGDRLVVGPEASGASPDASKSPSFRVEGEVLVRTGPDGSVLRADRLAGQEKGASAIVGGWRYCHPTGAIAYERYTDAGRLLFRLPMQPSKGRYALSENTLTLTKPQSPDVKLTVEVRGEDLVVSKSDGGKVAYRREKAGAWYALEHGEKCTPSSGSPK